MTVGLPIMGSIFTPLAKSVLLPFGLSVAMSATNVAIQNKIHGSATTALIISNEEMEDILKTVKSIEESGLKIKNETIKTVAKEQKARFFPMLLGALASNILGNTSSGQGVIRAGEGEIQLIKIFNAACSFN